MAYVQQLETSRVKLNQLEQELDRARKHGIYIGGSSRDHISSANGAANARVTTFDPEYAHLRAALTTHVTDIELRILVEGGMAHYDVLFRMRSVATKFDVFHLVSGMWKTHVKHCFMWMGGFRQSERLKILKAQLEPLTEQRVISMDNLQRQSQQAKDALSQGMEALQQSLPETLAVGSLGASNVVNYMGHMEMVMGKLGMLEKFVHQADNLRQQTL